MNAPAPVNPALAPGGLKLGVFCANTMPALTTVPELFAADWSQALTVARMADDMGLDALVPIARWKGYVDDDPGHPSHAVLDPFAYAAAMAQATCRIAVFATTHAPTLHPLVVARTAATIDAISGGRFGLNVVGGWNRREFDMFGIALPDHDARYAYLAEWLGLVRRLWGADGEFDHASEHFTLTRALSRPRPVQGDRMPIMNAGFSATGTRFAARHSDIGLIGLFGTDAGQWAEQVSRYKALARDEYGREVRVWTNAQLVLRDTDAEAQAYLRHYSEVAADGPAIDGFVSTLARENNVAPDSEQMRFLRRTVALGSGLPLVGGPETVADTLAALHRAGLDGVILSCVDFVDGLHRFGRDVLPRLVAAGVRDRVATG